MNRSAEMLMASWQLNEGASTGLLQEAESALGRVLPEDYVDFMRRHDGGEGFIGKNYLILWRAEELVEFNKEYEVDQYAPGLILFGSSGGGEAFGFDVRAAMTTIVRVPFIGMAWECAVHVGNTFAEFIEQLKKS